MKLFYYYILSLLLFIFIIIGIFRRRRSSSINISVVVSSEANNQLNLSIIGCRKRTALFTRNRTQTSQRNPVRKA